MKHLMKHEIEAMIGLELFIATNKLNPEDYRKHIERIWAIIEEMRQEVRQNCTGNPDVCHND
jgi:hypothetical protein